MAEDGSGCLSTVTVTKRVVNAAVPIYQRVSTFEELRAIIKPVAHYDRKTANLKILCQQIIKDHAAKYQTTVKAC